MKKIRLLLIVAFIGISTLHAAKRPLLYWSLAINNFVAAKPVTGFPKLFYSQFHPGITIGTGFNWVEKPKYNWTQSFKVGFFSHRYIQRSFVLYTELGYRYKLGSKIGLTIALGGGYLHMIPATQVYELSDDGDWEKKKFKSRPQGLISLSLGFDYKITDSGIRTFIRYQNMLQTPFVPGYVPILPYNVLHIGVAVPVSLLKKGSKNGK